MALGPSRFAESLGLDRHPDDSGASVHTTRGDQVIRDVDGCPVAGRSLASGTINGAATLTVELIQPDNHPHVVRIVWPSTPTITTPRPLPRVASTAMRLLAEASTTLARIKRADGSDPLTTKRSIRAKTGSTCEEESDDCRRLDNG